MRWTVMLDKTLENPLDYKEVNTVHPKGNQSRIFIGRTDAEGEAPILWPPDVKNWPDAGKDWRQEEKGMTEWNGWMASLSWWTWVWTSSGSWWWTGRPGRLQSMGLQRAGHNWATELNWNIHFSLFSNFPFVLWIFLGPKHFHKPWKRPSFPQLGTTDRVS